MEASASELRAGENIKAHALILNATKFKESDKIITLYTAELGKCTALARGASRSLKRFGAAVEPMCHVVAYLKAPQNKNAGSHLFELLQCDLKNSFLHLRESYQALESAAFVLRLVQDFCSENLPDPLLFKALGRFLRDSEGLEFVKFDRLARIAFWSWFAKHAGYGDFSRNLSFLKENPRFEDLWDKIILVDEINLEVFFRNFATYFERVIQEKHEVEMYRLWLEATGLKWEFCEKWLQLTK